MIATMSGAAFTPTALKAAATRSNADAGSQPAPSQPQSGQNRSSAAKTDPAATPARTDPGRNSSARTNANAADAKPAPTGAATGTDAIQNDTARDDGGTGDFAALLAGSTPTDTVMPPTAPLPTAPATTDTQPALAESPDQLLALLSGAWAMPAATTTATAAAASGAAVGALPDAAAHTAPQPAKATATAAVLPPPVAAPAAGAAAADAGSASFAALAALAIRAPGADRSGRDASTGSADAPAPIENLTLTGAAPTLAAARTSAPPPTAPLAMPADPDAGFDDGFGTRITWMAEQRVGHAQIRINPEHVGPIEVRVQLDGNRVSAEFTSLNADVRQAIEASLPRLREMLSQQGMQLGQADVGQGQSGRRDETTTRPGHPSATEADTDPRNPAGVIRSSRGLLDEYA